MVDEPLSESAPIASRIAAEACVRDPVTGETCAWYHGTWQYLRLLGVAKTSGGHVAFLVAALRDLARSAQHPKVLVSGSGDYSMPAHVLWAYREERASIDLHVLDRCETPLALSRWYASRTGATVRTAQADAIDYQPGRAFDVVMTNSFLGYFDRYARRRLFARWGEWLRPSGKLLFTNRLRPSAGDEAIGFSVEQATRLVEAVRREAQSRAGTIDIDPDEIAQRARRYAERFRSYPLHSADEVIDLLQGNGFSIDRLDTATAAARAGNDAVSGPSTAEQADYVRVIATRC